MSSSAKKAFGARLSGLIAMTVCLTSGPLYAAKSEFEPLYVDLRLGGDPVEENNCEGGDWSLRWTGSLPAESNLIDDLLISYSSFDSTHQQNWPLPAPSFRSSPMVCRDYDGKVILQGSLQAGGRKDMRGLLMLKQDPSVPSPSFSFSIDDLGDCRISMTGHSFTLEGVMLGLQTGILAQTIPEIEVTREEMEKGFTKRYKLSGMVSSTALNCINMALNEDSYVQLRYKAGPNDPKVDLKGCIVLVKGQGDTIVAEGEPPGGSYRFVAEQGDVFGISPGGKQATVTGKSPGRGTVTVEYHLNGKMATATLEGGVVELVSVNQGEPLPKLGLYGLDGKPSSKVYSFDLQVNPDDGGTMLIFSAENESIANVLTSSKSLQIQPVREGKSRILAKTSCGAPIGDPIPFEVVPCDDEVLEELTRQEEQLIRRQQELVKRITRMTADPEFDRAGREIANDTRDFAIKMGEMIVSSLTAAAAASAKGAVAAREVVHNVERLRFVSALWDSYNAVNDALSGNLNKAYINGTVLGLGKDWISVPKTFWEARDVAAKFGQDLGTLFGFAEELAMLEEMHKPIQRDLNRVWRSLKQCRTRSGEPEAEPTTPETGDAPVSREPEMGAEPEEFEVIDVAEEPQSESGPSEGTPPSSEPERSIWGLACLDVERNPARAAQNLRKLKDGIERYQREIINPHMKNLEEVEQVRERLAAAVEMPEGPELDQRFREIKAQIEGIFERYRHFGAAAELFDSLPDQCPEVLDGQVLDFRTVKWKLGP